MNLCSACKRFGRGNTCPFCGAAMEERASRSRPHVSRAALLVVGALSTQCNCGKEETIAQPYGAPPNPPQPVIEDAGTNASDAALPRVPPKDKI